MKAENRVINILGVVALVVCLAITYEATLLWMYARYMAVDTYYSHGFLVPFISIFLVYQQREKLLSVTQEKSMVGLLIVVFALLLHILGTILYVFSISGFSIFFLIVGIVLFLYGSKVSKVVWFPVLFLIFMFPLPMAVIEIISFPLKIFAAKTAVWFVSALGVPVYGEGFNILIPAGSLLVGNPCSGLRSLIAFLAIGSIFAYLAPLSNGKKVLLFLASVPIALFSNIVRIPILILVSHFYGLEAATPETLVHQGSGVLVFVIGFILLLLFSRALEWRS